MALKRLRSAPLEKGWDMKLKLVVVVLALGGCVSEPDIVSEAFVTPDGVAAHIVYCGGPNSSMAECYDDARKICGGNYAMIRESVSPRTHGGRVSSENRSIQIACRA